MCSLVSDWQQGRVMRSRCPSGSPVLSKDLGIYEAHWLSELNALHSLSTVAREGKNGQLQVLRGNGRTESWLTIHRPGSLDWVAQSEFAVWSPLKAKGCPYRKGPSKGWGPTKVLVKIPELDTQRATAPLAFLHRQLHLLTSRASLWLSYA